MYDLPLLVAIQFTTYNHGIISVDDKRPTKRIQVNQESGHEKSHLQYDSLQVFHSALFIALQLRYSPTPTQAASLLRFLNLGHSDTHTPLVGLL
jgi:hypothetical protein